MKEYVVIYEVGATSWGAHVPDLPVCLAVGSTFEDVQQLITEGIQLYVDSLREDGLPIPEPKTRSGAVAVAA